MPLSSPDPIMFTPAHGKKTAPASSAYDSADDDGDELLNDYETVPTQPWKPPQLPFSELKSQIKSSSPPPFTTQPTQLLGTPRKGPVVEVAASSPFSPARRKPSSPAAPKISNLMAPPGTTFRPPVAVTKPAALEINSDEEDPPVDISSDEDDGRSREIPSTKFLHTGNKSGGSVKSFAGLVGGYKYDSSSQGSSSTPQKRPFVDDMVGAYSKSGSRPAKQPRQTGPSKALPVYRPRDITLDDLPDWTVREKVKRLRLVYPDKSIRDLQSALMNNKGNVEDASAYLLLSDHASESPNSSPVKSKETITISSSDEDLPSTIPIAKSMKQKVQGKTTLAERYSSTQHAKKVDNVPKKVDNMVFRPQKSPVSTSFKSRKRLVQGRRNRSSPVAASSPPPESSLVERPQLTKPAQPVIISDDEGVASDETASSEEDKAYGSIDTKLLRFINTRPKEDLMDLAVSKQDIAAAIVAGRPYRNLDQVRRVTLDPVSAGAKPKKQSKRRPIGERFVDVAEDMMLGYDAVDELVARCEAIAKPLTQEMRKWGVNVKSMSKSGELDLVDLQSEKHDSGTGTPSDSPASMTQNLSLTGILQKPSMMSDDFQLKDYQKVGLTWMNLLWSKRLSCILGDDMGLGKTCQVIALLSHLCANGIQGPHLVVAPVTTLDNWCREFEKFSPGLVIEPYRAENAAGWAERQYTIESNIDSINVVITNYDRAVQKMDNKWLRQFPFQVTVFDEGQALKSSKSLRYKQLMRLPAEFKLLLTGTPLQNNLQELVALLAFIMPDIFEKRREDLDLIFKHKAKMSDEDHTALLSAQRVNRARSMMAPFILRRRKEQVLGSHLPKKHSRVVRCDLTPTQKRIYDDEVEAHRQAAAERKEGKFVKAQNNLMKLRFAAIHPLLHRKIYDDKALRKIAKACLKEPDLPGRDEDAVLEDLETYTDIQLHKLALMYPRHVGKFRLQGEWMHSGKVAALCELLKKFKANGDRTLVFSQFKEVMDILELVLETLKMDFFRLDGETSILDRQPMIDAFYADESIPVFMLSTKAGGTGINLACANKVIIFDSSFNPQEDVQAENRAHRVGQTREVEVIRLVSKDTVEEAIHALGNSKLALDAKVAGEETGTGTAEGKKIEAKGKELVEKMLAATDGDGDLKDEFLTGLKDAGLDMSAAE